MTQPRVKPPIAGNGAPPDRPGDDDPKRLVAGARVGVTVGVDVGARPWMKIDCAVARSLLVSFFSVTVSPGSTRTMTKAREQPVIGVVEEVEQCCQIAVATGLKGASLTDDQLQAMDDALGRAWK